MLLYPLKFEPYLAPRVWGGKALAKFCPSIAQAAEPIGEIWTIGGSQAVTNGFYAGQTLDELYQRFPIELGNSTPESKTPFPLLIKWLRAEHWLSVQVHPDDSLACLFSGSSAQGKEEAWYVTENVPGAELILGAHPHSRCSEFLSANGAEMLHFLSKIKPTVGDCLCLKPGLIHALGPGLTVLEVQQNSELTYRLYDWERLGLDGQPRQLHTREAAEVLRRCWSVNLHKNEKLGFSERSSSPRPFVQPTVGKVLLQAEHFRLEVLKAELEGNSWHTDPTRPEIIVCTRGSLQVALHGRSEMLQNGESCLLAAGGAKVELSFSQDSEAVRITLPR